MIKLLEEGASAPQFDFLASDQPVVVAFFKVSCPVCQMTFPFLDRMSSSGTHRFVGVSQDHRGATDNFNSRFGVNFPTLLDPENEGYPASNAFGISQVPTAFLVEPSGKISWVMEGFSKAQMNDLGNRVGVAPFRPGEYVPEWKAG